MTDLFGNHMLVFPRGGSFNNLNYIFLDILSFLSEISHMETHICSFRSVIIMKIHIMMHVIETFYRFLQLLSWDT